MVPKNFEDAFLQVKSLAEKFAANETAYLSPKYQEAEVRQDFLDKFFVSLGWDVYHHEHPNPYEREVRIEKSVMVENRGKRADYAFFAAPNFVQPKFLAEAKKPARQLDNPYDCFQAVRYGWNSNTPLAILTDFEQFLILDSRYKPKVETASNTVLEKFHYSQFLDEEEFRRIYYLFSREAVGDSSLEKFVEGLKKAKKTKAAKAAPAATVQPVDQSFLSELDVHREELARGFKSQNPELNSDELTEITQRTLDRLVFIRFLEDKLVEPSEIIDRLGSKSGSAWRDFIAEIPRLNSHYNGIIFKPHAILDSAGFQPDEKAFSDTTAWLSHRNSAYDFNTIPIHILGSIYERFLGKTIIATDKRARVEEKPEVRKAGGVYYTPDFIVRYIVENTIGKLIEGKSPDTIAKMRFADIACGSGSFLLGVFDHLIEHHVEWHNASKSRRNDAIKKGFCRETADGTLQLTIPHKREILLNNIYGVDLDAQAVEVAQLSLYLKLLAEETTATAQQYLAGFKEQLLPSLNQNIVHGNSLVDFDVMDGLGFDAHDHRKLYPMDFESTFPKVFANGGFDAIVGNPPYVRIQTMQDTSPLTVEYLKKNYISARRGNYDIYVVFVERGLSLLNGNGKLGYILPHKFFNAEYGRGLRGLITGGKHLSHIVHFGHLQVFEGATTYTCLLHLDSPSQDRVEFTKVSNIAAWRDDGDCVNGSIDADSLSELEWNFAVGEGAQLVERLKGSPRKLGDVASIFVGLQTSADDVFILDVVTEQRECLIVRSKALDEVVTLEKDLLHSLVSGTDVKGYGLLSRRQVILFPYDVENESATLIPFSTLAREFPLTADYLSRNRSRLEQRERGKFRDNLWYRFGRSQNLGIQNRVKICVPRLVERLNGAFDRLGEFYLDNVDVGGVSIRPEWESAVPDLRYVLALINSKLLGWFFPYVSAPFRGDYRSANRQFLSQLPIYVVDFDNQEDTAVHDQIVELVDKMLGAKESLATARTDADRQFYERYCNTLDRQIDELVYDLYDITPEERKLVEGKN